jgi:hypothetical protein
MLVAVLGIVLFWPAVRGEFVWDNRGLLGAGNPSVDECRDALAGFTRASASATTDRC